MSESEDSAVPQTGISIASHICEIRVISENLAYLTLNLPKANHRGEWMPYDQKTTVQSGHGTFLERIWGFERYNVEEMATRTRKNCGAKEEILLHLCCRLGTLLSLECQIYRR